MNIGVHVSLSDRVSSVCMPRSGIAGSYGSSNSSFSRNLHTVLQSGCTSLHSHQHAWKQPRCPSADAWIRKLWYIYTMEYYSAIKKNSFKSVLMRWMKLEPIIQSEVSQKDKGQYSILMHIYIESRKMIAITLYAKQKKRHRCQNRILDSVGEGEGGMFRENSFETCILSRVKQITSPGWMHETSAQVCCTGKTQRNRVEKEVGGGIGMGNTCKSMANSCQCMTKTTTIL